MSSTSPSRANVNAEILLWQSRVRMMVALLAGGVEFVLQRHRILQGNALYLLEGVCLYLAAITILTWLVQRLDRAPSWAVALTVLADILFIFGSTAVASPPQYFDRILIFAFLVLHLTETYFGPGQAAFAGGLVVAGYLWLVRTMMHRGAHLAWPEEVWSVVVFALAAAVFVLQYGSFRRRLNNIAALFERVEEGDFSQTYDVAADERPDAITLVGRVYNRVRSQLESMVLTDPLTNCLNRRGFDQALAREVARSARAGSKLSLLAIDLDHFKEVNDSRGHLAGDAVLREFGALLIQSARAGDVVARSGGEEFSMLLPDTTGTGAFQLADRLCATFSQHTFHVNGRDLQLTVSIGVVSTGDRAALGDRAKSVAEELKLRADEALYAAKRTGRNRARAWDATMSMRSGEMPKVVLPELARDGAE
ncbi:MAG TPA: GGDEF domain-containing protein [Gemmatimonadaceae bacterium]|nr:GGDEF domain-containing protein [Gemmatimonadaceae bacterium]